MTAPPVVAEVVRSGVVESVHRGSLVVLGTDGDVRVALGDVERPVLGRSSNKPLQAVGLLELGWEPDDEQLVLACASHSGEPEHLEVVRRTLAGAGLSEDALRCPPMAPLSEPAFHALLRAGGEPTPLHMNCSGKHAAMLATAAVRGEDPATYLDLGGPLQAELQASLARQAGADVAAVVVDGCGAPQHALPLVALARAFAAIATAADGPRARVARAIRRHPHLLGGTGRDVTDLCAGVPGLVAKDGAEGVYAAALQDGSAVALKIEDGASRARSPVLVAALRFLGVTGDALDRHAAGAVLGGGRPVGEVRVPEGLLG